MKLRAAFIFLVLTAVPSAALCAQQIVPPDTQMTVKLLAPLSTKTSKAGDKISAQVIAPPAFQGDFVGGDVRKVKNGGKIHGTSVLNFTFGTLYHQGQAVPIASNVLSVMNSRGQENVDEEGEVVKKKNNIGKLALGSAGGGLLGGVLGGWKGAAIGAAIGLAASVVLVEATAKGPSIDFAPGSEFVLSVKQRRGKIESAPTPTPGPPQLPATSSSATPSTTAGSVGELAVTSSAECTGPGTPAVSNGTRGTINVQAGTGSFAGLSPAAKTIAVASDAPISGTVQLSVLNQGAAGAVAPLIWTPSWGDPASSWHLIQGWVRDGQNSFTAPIQLAAPQAPGTYHIAFAFQLEMNGANVASATNWAKGQPVWHDGNDIANLDARQIAEAQQFGCTTDRWLSQQGYEWILVPVDAITIHVGSAVAAASQRFSILHSFLPSENAQGLPALVEGSDGNFYGTSNPYGPSGVPGAAFRMDPSGKVTILHYFAGRDGGFANATGLVQGSDGEFYGTAQEGGALFVGFSNLGDGAVFKMDAHGNVTVLHSFSSSDGAGPYSALLLAKDGDFYGTTQYGGSGACGAGRTPPGCGTVFRIDSTGHLTVLHSFSGADGAFPEAALIQGNDGDFYGTTSGGGSGPCTAPAPGYPSGCGTVFKMDGSGHVTVLHSFAGPDGRNPSTLVQASDGYFYGVTGTGGSAGSANCSSIGCGTIFKVDSSGSFVLLHSFSGPDGSGPAGPLVKRNDGFLYGTSSGGGRSGDGTIFRTDASGNVTVLHNFSGSDGQGPGGLLLGADGNLYGTTSAGGAAGSGVIFELRVPQSPAPADSVKTSRRSTRADASAGK